MATTPPLPQLLLLAVVVAHAPAIAALQTTATSALSPATVALVEAWPDGRTNYELTGVRRATMWTPGFPRIEGFTLHPGAVPVYAVQFARVLVGGNIRVDISVLLGSAEPPGVPVATVIVSPGSHIVVEELRKFGVQPVMLSMASVLPMTPYFPTVCSVSPRIEISSVELLNAPYPGYRITLRNLAAQDVSNFNVQSYRGDQRTLSALKRSDDGRPLMKPGESYAFDMNITSGAGESVPTGTWSPRPLDVVEIVSVRWADGSSEGASPFPHVDAFVEGQSGRRCRCAESSTRCALCWRNQQKESSSSLPRETASARFPTRRRSNCRGLRWRCALPRTVSLPTSHGSNAAGCSRPTPRHASGSRPCYVDMNRGWSGYRHRRAGSLSDLTNPPRPTR